MTNPLPGDTEALSPRPPDPPGTAANSLDSLGLPPVALRPPPEDGDGRPSPRGAGETMGPAPADLTPPPRLRIDGEIARGGMGAVFQGRDTALGRPVAVKVLLAAHEGRPELLRRFVEEAQIGGQLQHPGVVPVYELGRLPDQRPYFTMKLVKGQTLAKLLAGRADREQDRRRFLGIVLQVCQALAYAHARGVIHRDLKPSNVMVGAFGEVQVMDWGLAKVLDAVGGSGETHAAEASIIRPVPSDLHPAEADSRTQWGQVLGTPAYMPPEQARGEVERLDERCDVFGLGAILCEVLTGQPPFGGAADEALRRARAGEVAGAFARLDGGGADAELVGLAKRCLAPEPADRPREAGAVAAALTEYLESVEARLRRAELGRAEAQVRAGEERKRRRVSVALAASLLLLVVLGGGGAWWLQQRGQMTDAAVDGLLSQAELLREQARANPHAAEAKYGEALATAHEASRLAGAGGASSAARRRADERVARLESEVEAAGRDRRLLRAILEVRGPREGPRFRKDERGLTLELAEPSADDQFAEAFRAWGLDVDDTPTAVVAERVKARPPAVLTEVIAALDEWAGERQRLGLPAAKVRRVADLAEALDDAPGSRRAELRELLRDEALPRERALGALAAALRPVPVPFDAGPGPARARLRHLAEQTSAADEPVLGLLALARALRVAGDEALAERLLREATWARPREVVLHHELGKLLEGQAVPRWAEAAECYAAARALRPELGEALANALVRGGRGRQGLDLYRRLLAGDVDNPWLLMQFAAALDGQGRYQDAEGEYRKALRLRPDSFDALMNLGNELYLQERYKDAEVEYRKALALRPDDGGAHASLGGALYGQHRDREAEAEYRKALDLDRADLWAQRGLGAALVGQGRCKEAEEECRQAILLNPDDAGARTCLGTALIGLRRYREAEAACRHATRLSPDDAVAHSLLGSALLYQSRFKEAEEACRQAIRLKRTETDAHLALALALSGQGRYRGAEEACRTALDLKPDSVPLHYTLGYVLCGQGRLEAAEQACRKALLFGPGDAGAHATLSTVLTARGRYKEAEEECRTAIGLNRDDAGGYVGLGAALCGQRRYGDAEQACREAIRLNPDDDGAHYTLGSALIGQGRYPEAEAECREAIDLNPDDADSYRYLGNALCGQGRYAEAAEAYREAIRRSPDVGR